MCLRLCCAALLLACCAVVPAAELLDLPAGWNVRESGPRKLIAWHDATKVEVVATFTRHKVEPYVPGDVHDQDSEDALGIDNRTGILAWTNAAKPKGTRYIRTSAPPGIDPWDACAVRSGLQTTTDARRTPSGRVDACLQSRISIQFRYGTLGIVAFCEGEVPAATATLHAACKDLRPAAHLHTLGRDTTRAESDAQDIAKTRAVIKDGDILPDIYGANTELRRMPPTIPQAYRGNVLDTVNNKELRSRYTERQHVGVHPQRGGGTATVAEVIGIFDRGAPVDAPPRHIIISYVKETNGIRRGTQMLTLLPDGLLLRHFVTGASMSHPRLVYIESQPTTSP